MIWGRLQHEPARVKAAQPGKKQESKNEKNRGGTLKILQ